MSNTYLSNTYVEIYVTLGTDILYPRGWDFAYQQVIFGVIN